MHRDHSRRASLRIVQRYPFSSELRRSATIAALEQRGPARGPRAEAEAAARPRLSVLAKVRLRVRVRVRVRGLSEVRCRIHRNKNPSYNDRLSRPGVPSKG